MQVFTSLLLIKIQLLTAFDTPCTRLLNICLEAGPNGSVWIEKINTVRAQNVLCTDFKCCGSLTHWSLLFRHKKENYFLKFYIGCSYTLLSLQEITSLLTQPALQNWVSNLIVLREWHCFPARLSPALSVSTELILRLAHTTEIPIIIFLTLYVYIP